MGNEANPVETAYECAACNMLRRKCEENCVFASHFPPNDPRKFVIAHWDVPTERRGDAVKSIGYQARARVRDPVYSCAAQWLGLGNKYTIFNPNWKTQKQRVCPCVATTQSIGHFN
eukprot:Gb_19567 [translate_table: standard]